MAIRSTRWVGLALLLGTGLAAWLPACSEKKGALMLAVQTDMKAPGDVNEVTLAVSVDGKVSHVFTSEVAPNGEVYFPATVAITEPENPDAVVRIRVLASRFGEVRVLREAITTVPKDGRVGLIRMPLRFADYGTSGQGTVPVTSLNGSPSTDAGSVTTQAAGLVADAWDPFVNVTNLCGADKTSDNGECVDAHVDSAALPEFVEAEVFGGGDRSGSNATCFDVAQCFDSAVSLTPIDPVACTFAKPEGLSQLNVAVAAAGIGEPIAGTDSGLVPLDEGPGGFQVNGTVITIPRVFCRPPDPSKPSPKVQVTAVFASAACAAKKDTMTLCGPAFVANQVGRDAGGGSALRVDAAALPPRDGGGFRDGSIFDGSFPKPDGSLPPKLDGGDFIGEPVGPPEAAVTALTLVGNKLYFVRGTPPMNPTSFGQVFSVETNGQGSQGISADDAGTHTPGAGIFLGFGLAHASGKLGWTSSSGFPPAGAVFTALGAAPQRTAGPAAPLSYYAAGGSATNLYFLDVNGVDRVDPTMLPASWVPARAYDRPGGQYSALAVTSADRLFLGRDDGKIETCPDAKLACVLEFNTDTSVGPGAGGVKGIAPVEGVPPLAAYYVQAGANAGLHLARTTDAQTLEVPFLPIPTDVGHAYPLAIAGGYVFFAVGEGGGSIAYVKVGEKTPGVFVAGQGTVYSIVADATNKVVYWSYGDAQGNGGIRKRNLPLK